mmetsp:Transcript_8733/g.24086  ORF Transcript_8733/g.24086 Transcript_8733/m.24086 type:complete len:198 (+) Transcript_8733:10-603(+)
MMGSLMGLHALARGCRASSSLAVWAGGMRKTVKPKGPQYPGPRLWHLIDARAQVVGRLSSQIATLLMGKHKPTYVPRFDCGDHVVVINAKDVVFTGRKWDQKLYRHHTGWPGGLREVPAKRMLERHAERIIGRAVRGMLPKNMLRKQRIMRLRVYPGVEHPHDAQLSHSYARYGPRWPLGDPAKWRPLTDLGEIGGR